MNEKTYSPDTEWIAFLYETHEGPARYSINRQQHVIGATRSKAVENAMKLQVKNSSVEVCFSGLSLIPAKEYYELNSGRSWKA